MRRAPASAVARAVGGVLVGEDRPVSSAVIDSREVADGALFFALPGTRTDGHVFVHDALARGAPASVIRRGVPTPARAIVVDDPGAALLRLARSEREALHATVVGITGSVGKTTTKDFTAAILTGAWSVAASPRSFNNEIGLPLTILAADEATEVLVAELGAGAVGEIATLCTVARPDIGVVTAVGPAHLETFGSLPRIADAKAELVEALPRDGLAILNADDPVVACFASRTAARVLRYGRGPDAEVRAEEVRVDAHGRPRFRVTSGKAGVEVELSVVGEHMVVPALAAIGCGIALGVRIEDVAERLRGASRSPGRMQELESPGGLRVLHDAYNANPMSVHAALRALAAARDHARAFAVLGEMAQLGSSARREHEGVGRAAAALGLDGLVAVGEAAGPIADAALDAGMPRRSVRRCLDAAEAADAVRDAARAGDVVLVKASRRVGLERVVEGLVP